MGVVAALSVRIGASTQDFTNGLNSLLGQVDKAASGIGSAFNVPSLGTFGKSIGDITTGFASLSGVLSGLAVGKAIGDFIGTTSKLTDLSAKTSISVRELQRLDFAGSNVGVSLDTLATAATQLQKRLAGDDKGAAAAVRELGLSLDQLLGMGAGEQFEAIASALGSMEDPARQTFLAMELFGRGGATLLPLLRSDIRATGDEMERLGLIMSDKTVKAGDDLGDIWTKLGFAGTQLVATGLAPVLDHVNKLGTEKARLIATMEALNVDALIPAWKELSKWIGAVSTDIQGAPKLPGAPGGFGKANLDALPGMGDAKEAMRLFDDAQKKAKEAADEWKRFTDTVSGRDSIAEAQKWMKAVREIGGVTHLTADNQRQFNDVLGKALEAYASLGQQAPLAMAKLWAATFVPPGVIDRFDSLKNTLQEVGTLVSAPMAPLAGGPGVISGLGDLPGTQVAIGKPKLPGFLEQMFGSVKDFSSSISGVIMGALQGGGGVGKALGGFLGGGALSGITGKLTGMLGEKGIGGALGGILGSVLPGVGNILGALGGSAISGLFGKLFGGEKKKTNQARDAFIEQAGGIDALKKSAEEAGFSLDKLLSTKKVKDFQGEVGKLTSAMEAHKATMQAISDITEGVNARSANVTGQGDLDVVGAGAVAAFALQMQSGSTAIAAFQALTPAITAMSTAMATGNFTLSESAMRLTELGAILNANNVEFTNLGASGQILQAMLQGNIRDGTLFAAVATDIGTQIQTVIDRGVPMAQVFALAQPQLQALWEAQQKWGFAVDETTQRLLTEAAAQGFVGQQMKSVNQQILDVLLAIGKVLGADIPAAFANLPAAAQSAANGINAALATVRTAPTIYPGGMTVDEIPAMASGGIVRRPTLALIGEAGPEAVVPLNGAFNTGGGTAVIEVDGRVLARVMVPHIPGEVQRYGLV